MHGLTDLDAFVIRANELAESASDEVTRCGHDTQNEFLHVPFGEETV